VVGRKNSCDKLREDSEERIYGMGNPEWMAKEEQSKMYIPVILIITMGTKMEFHGFVSKMQHDACI